METKKIVEALRSLVNYQGIHHFYHTGKYGDNFPVGDVIDEAAERLEELKSDKENLIHYNADLNNQLNKAESHIEKLEKQLSKQQPEWIMAEDSPPPSLGYYLVTALDLDTYKYYTTIAKWHGHMFTAQDDTLGQNLVVIAWLPKSANPAPLVPTFKDIFLKRFPKTETVEDRPALCLHTIFPYVEMCNFTPEIELKCKECWNQPYFDEEGEGDADNSK